MMNLNILKNSVQNQFLADVVYISYIGVVNSCLTRFSGVGKSYIAPFILHKTYGASLYVLLNKLAVIERPCSFLKTSRCLSQNVVTFLKNAVVFLV